MSDEEKYLEELCDAITVISDHAPYEMGCNIENSLKHRCINFVEEGPM